MIASKVEGLVTRQFVQTRLAARGIVMCDFNIQYVCFQLTRVCLTGLSFANHAWNEIEGQLCREQKRFLTLFSSSLR